MKRLDRRTMIKGLGIACALPYLEAMGTPLKKKEIKKRSAFIFFPNGCSNPPKKNSSYKNWRWHPHGEGKEYIASKVLEPLDKMKPYHTVLSGLSHPRSRKLLGHIAGDTWLTGGDLRTTYNNSISMDQVIAHKYGTQTRYPYLTLSCDGGVGYKSRVSTLSFDHNGEPIPSQHNPQQIFDGLFAVNGSKQQRKNRLINKKKTIDLVLEDAKSLTRRLGKNDRQKLGEYMHSLSSIEDRVVRAQNWLDKPLPKVDSSKLKLGSSIEASPKEYIRTMYDLMALAFETDVTRTISYMIAREDGLGIGDQIPTIALGLKGYHTIQHDRGTGAYKNWGKLDRWLSIQFNYFLEKLKNISDENGSILDSTMIVYGSAQSNTHNARNYPMILAGGKNMGFKHNRCLRYTEKTPLADVYLGMLQAYGIDIKSFADSHDKERKQYKILTSV